MIEEDNLLEDNSTYDYECVITLKGQTAKDLMACGEEDLKYIFTEEAIILCCGGRKDIKSIKFYNRAEERKRNELISANKRIVGKNAFKDM